MDAPPPGLRNVSSQYQEIHKIARVSIEQGYGNCFEKACIAGIQAANHGAQPVEIFQLQGRDHAFTVIGRANGSDPADPRTWGNKAVIVDGWNNESYPASEIAQHMHNNGQIPRTTQTMTVVSG